MHIESNNIKGVYNFMHIIKWEGVHPSLHYTSFLQNGM